jgi:hypothetical protein
MRRVGPALGSVLLGLFLLGCSAASVDGPTIHLENRTDIPVAIHLDGAWVGTYGAGVGVDVPIGREPPPRAVEVYSPSGALLLTWEIPVPVSTGTGGSTSVTLPCGAIRVSYGKTDASPLEGPTGPSSPCP